VLSAYPSSVFDTDECSYQQTSHVMIGALIGSYLCREVIVDAVGSDVYHHLGVLSLERLLLRDSGSWCSSHELP
jgi:hypothetical protein